MRTFPARTTDRRMATVAHSKPAKAAAGAPAQAGAPAKSAKPPKSRVIYLGR